MRFPMRSGLAVLAAIAASAAPAQQQPRPNGFSEKLRALQPVRQRAVLRRAVLDSAMYCGHSDTAALRGRYKNLVMWTVKCSPGGEFGVFIGPDGSVQARRCTDLAKLGLPPCAPPVAKD